tara:strand:+ start:164 stop:763 length:600 start_codon:yes stop_codon:yes gene_type:complete
MKPTLSLIKKNLLIKLIGIFFLAGFYIYTSPYLALFFLKESIENKNTKRAENYINFNSLRNSLESQIMSAYRQSTINYSSEISIPKIGLLFFDPLMKSVVNSIVSATITPDGLELLIRKGELSSKSERINNIGPINNDQNANSSMSLYYESLNIFILSSSISEIYEPIKFRFSREGIAHWRLFSVEIPINQLTDQVVKQ